ncbi:MAG: DUF503 domain-containing protein [Candidatus Omnitrophota bacterium]
MAEDSFHAAIVTAELYMPFFHSLKEKRRVLKSAKDKLRQRFNISVAEVGFHEKWQRAMLAIAMVHVNKKQIEIQAQEIRKFWMEEPEVELLSFNLEFV